jgi:hypothetical protein
MPSSFFSISLGFIGAYKNRLSLLKVFIGCLILILVLQFIAGIVTFALSDNAEDQLRTTLMESLPKYESSHIGREWDRLQRTWTCCGVDQADDWFKHGKRTSLPKSCCIHSDCSATAGNGTEFYSNGCYQSARNLFFRYSKALGGVSTFFCLVEIIGVVLAIVLTRNSTNNYGTV